MLVNPQRTQIAFIFAFLVSQIEKESEELILCDIIDTLFLIAVILYPQDAPILICVHDNLNMLGETNASSAPHTCCSAQCLHVAMAQR